jgi:hypothetical protein
MHKFNDLLEWRDLPSTPVGNALKACLLEIDDITREFVSEVRELSGYPESAVSDEDLTATAKVTIEVLLRTVGGLPVGDDMRKNSTGIGHRRARQGIPLDSLLRAVRMVFRLLWRRMRKHVADEDLMEFTEGVVPIWDAVEAHTFDVHAGYLAELEASAREAEHEREFLLRRFLEDPQAEPRLVQQTAMALGVDPERDFLVAVASRHYRLEFRAAAAQAGADHLVHSLDGESFVIVEVGPGEPHPPAWLLPLQVGIAPLAHGFSAVSRHWRVAHRLSQEIPRDGAERALTMDDDWLTVVVSSADDFGDVLAERTLSRLSQCTPKESALLVEAVRAYLREGSVSAAATTLFCHRNTVLNRLSRFADLTGLSPTLPSEAALILFALESQVRSSRDTE